MTPEEKWLLTKVVILGLILVAAGIIGCAAFVRALLRNDEIEKARVEAWLAHQREEPSPGAPPDDHAAS